MLAPVPLYFTAAISPVPLVMFHAALGAVVVTILVTRRTALAPRLVRFLAYGYLLFFPIDVLFLSESLIRSSSNLLFFIGVYLVLEEPWEKNYTKRLLITFLLFVAAIATSVHLSIVGFIVLFSFLAFGEVIAVSHAATVASLDVPARPLPSWRASFFYVVISGLLAAAMFPFLPRIGSPMLLGPGTSLSTSATGLSDTINFNDARTITPDPQVVARIWMDREAVPFFTPLRLRGAVYDSYRRGEWRARRVGAVHVAEERFGVYQTARPAGFTRGARIQQQNVAKRRLLLPAGTYAVADLPNLLQEPETGLYRLAPSNDRSIEFRVGMSSEVLPLEPSNPRPVRYLVTPEVAALTRQVIGDAREVRDIAARLESYLSETFQYVPDPAELGRPISVEEFLLRERRGHCEYFAAGMVVMLTSAGIPSRIVGGFYGGELNPLTGYFVVRKRDAHAWVEVWDGDRWRTYDPTPASMRPGTGRAGLVQAYASAFGDSVQFFWDRYILTFGTEDQVRLIAAAIASVQEVRKRTTAVTNGLGRRLTLRAAVIALLIAVLAVLLRGWIAERRRTPFQNMLHRLRHLGIDIAPTATDEEIVAAVRGARPEVSDAVRDIVEFHRLESFSARPVPPEVKVAARRALAVLTAVSR
jgi:transglutaminase-like putative cysteine protease